MSRTIYFPREGFILEKWFEISAESAEGYFRPREKYSEFRGECEYIGSIASVSDMKLHQLRPAECVEFKCTDDNKYYARIVMTGHDCVFALSGKYSILAASINPERLRGFMDCHYKESTYCAKTSKLITADEFQKYVDMFCAFS